MGAIARLQERRHEKANLRADLARESNLRVASEQMIGVYGERMAELEMLLAEPGWNQVASEGDDFPEDMRRMAISMARWLAIKSPLIRRRVRVQKAYVFGQGVEIAASDDEVNQIVQSFMDDHRNKRVLTSPEAMQEREEGMQTDGGMFLALFTNRMNGRVVVRTLPPTQVSDIVANPEDREEIRYYLRTWTQRIDGGTITRHDAYPDLQYLRTLAFDGKRPPTQIERNGLRWDVIVPPSTDVGIIHVRVGGKAGGKFGHPEVYAMFDWAAGFAGWLSDWQSVAKSLARYAWNLKTSGKISKATDKIGASPLDTGSVINRNPAPIPGSVFVAGLDGTNLDPIRTAGAQVKAEDGLLLRKMAAAASDFPDTIIGGDPDQGNLATAKTLDRPTELTMRLRQSLWQSIFTSVLDQVVIASVMFGGEIPRARVTNDEGNMTVELPLGPGGQERSATVNVSFPPIIEPDIGADAGAVIAAKALLPPRTAVELIMDIFGIGNQDEMLSLMFPDDGDPLGLVAQQARSDAAAAALSGQVPAAPAIAAAALAAAEEDWVREAAELRRMVEEKLKA